ncbi:MAG: restriction endonuclease, SacI family [Phycisphaerae bacterium]|nr:restriction endonuclease, SacI family [Phycisphaerae bacterium]
MSAKTREPFFIEARSVFQTYWKTVTESNEETAADISSNLPKTILEGMAKSINSSTKSYRYVLPTQLLAVMVDSSLDCRTVQEGSTLPGSFDARSLCKNVIVPFDRDHHNVLGGSEDPYVNNPLRIPSIIAENRSRQKNKKDYDLLCEVLAYAHEYPKFVPNLFTYVLKEIAIRLTRVSFVYPVPNRVSLAQTTRVIQDFLAPRTGGMRLQVVSIALFRALGSILTVFQQVRSAHVNASDASTGRVADIECLDASGNIALSVEVKDQSLTLHHIQTKLPVIREKGIRELLFLVRGGADQERDEAVCDLLEREFITGQNVYVCEFNVFSKHAFLLLGEQGRRHFLIFVGEALDEMKADMKDKMTWKSLLSQL